MFFLSSDSTQAQSLPVIVSTEDSETSSALDREIVLFFEMYRHRLLAYTTAFHIPAHESEEIVQEVFLSLFRHLQMGKSRKNLPSWIFRVAHNLALKQRHENQRWLNGSDTDMPFAEKQCDLSPNPEEQLLSTQRQKLLLNVVGALPEQDRCCLYLRAEGLRYRQIAHVLGISLGSVSASLTHSFSRLMRADER